MTIDVQGPDGSSFQFPDGTAHDVIAGAMQAHYGQPERSVADKLTGATSERYQTWPERLIRGLGNSISSGATLPGDVMAGRALLPSSGAVPGSVPFGDPASSGERVADLAGLVSPMSPAARIGEKAIPGVSKVVNKVETPSAEALLSSSTKGFDAARDAGVAIPGSGMQQMGAFLEQQLRNKGIHPEHAPDAYATIARLRDTPADAPLSIGDVHNIRQSFGNAAGNYTKPKDALAGSMGVNLVDKLLQTVAEKGDVVGAPTAEASGTLSKAIGNYAAATRSDSVTGREDLAALRAKVSNSGQNLDNSTRQRFVDIASEGKASRGFNQPEIDQATRIAEGGPATNTARFIGNALGGGGGLGMAVTGGLGAAGGAALGGLVGSPIAGAAIGSTVGPIIGASSKALANALTRREVAAMDNMVRQRSPLYEDMMANAGTIDGSRGGTEALAKALMQSYSGTADRNMPQNPPLRFTVYGRSPQTGN